MFFLSLPYDNGYKYEAKTMRISLINLCRLSAQNYLYFAAAFCGQFQRPCCHMLASPFAKVSVRIFLLPTGAASRTESSG